MVVSLAFSAAAHAQHAKEYEVKAAFLYNFAKFVQWPSNPPSGDSNSILLCVAGDDPFGKALERTVLGKTANGQPFVIQRFGRVENARGCRILFTDSNDERYIRSLIAAAGEEGVLTVGDAEKFCELGGIIGFVWEENKVRFQINVEAAQRARLKISSKLLSLAKVFREGY